MKTLLTLVALMLLTGCMYQRIDTGDIDSATKACEKHNGINSMSAFWTGAESVVCQDGTSISYLQFPKSE